MLLIRTILEKIQVVTMLYRSEMPAYITILINLIRKFVTVTISTKGNFLLMAVVKITALSASFQLNSLVFVIHQFKIPIISTTT